MNYKAYIREEEDYVLNYSDCVNKYLEIVDKDNDKIIFDIISENKINKIDLSFIGHLVLMKKNKSNIQINLVLPYNDLKDIKNKNQQSSIWKIMQSMAHVNMSVNDNVFNIKGVGTKFISVNVNEFKWFVLSKKFIPIIYLDEDSYENIFEDCNSLDDEVLNKCLYDLLNSANFQSEEYVYQKGRKKLFEYVNDNNYSKILSYLSFLRSLRDVRILRYYIEYCVNGNKSDNYRIGVVRKDDLKKKYYNKVRKVYDEMIAMPPVYSLMMAALTSSGMTSSAINDDNILSESNVIVEIWQFVKELVYGLNELAKNIIEHSSSKKGVLTGYIDDKGELRINVFDHGASSMLYTLKNKTYKLWKKNNLDIYKEDYDIIEDKGYKLSYLFESNDKYFLNQQSKRSTAHLGLQIFTKLIKENQGKFRVVSNDRDNKLLRYDHGFNKNEVSFLSPIGTNYQVHIKTLRKAKAILYDNVEVPEFENVENTINVVELLSYGDAENIDKYLGDKLISISLNKLKLKYRDSEDEMWADFKVKLNERIKRYVQNVEDKDFIVALDLQNVNNYINGSQLFRLLGKWELEYPSINLIVYGLSLDDYHELVKINKVFLSATDKRNISFWNISSVVLFYCHDFFEKNVKIYYANALWGFDVSDYVFINRLIKKNNYNSVAYYENNDNGINKNINSVNNLLFYKGKTLLPFDLIISINGKTIFENNAIALLGAEFETSLYSASDKEYDSEVSVNNMYSGAGFKIADSHFKLGSKIHISDFYYAKRFFQNSFFASKMAFIVTKYILNNYILSYAGNKNVINELTIIGYGIYSELFLSIIVKYVKAYCYDKNIQISINHNMYSDSENIKLIKGNQKPFKNIIILVPIASTFSTSLKIEEMLIKDDTTKELKVLNPHINVLAVTNQAIGGDRTYDKKSIEGIFGWKSHNEDEKLVDVSSFYDDKIKTQKYFISLSSKWFLIEKCSKCYPQKDGINCLYRKCDKSTCLNYYKHEECPLVEEPLYKTDKDSVTPSLVFGFPRSRDISSHEKQRSVILSNRSLECGHKIRNNNHFRYNINDETLLDENLDDVVKWINEISYYIKNESIVGVNEDSNVLIIAPKHFSNTEFINLVNDLVFSSSANIIHYDFDVNDAENFEVFYKKNIKDADKVIFVDDSIITGSTFTKANDYIKQVRYKESILGFDCAIFLINRSDYYSNDNIVRKLPESNRIYSFFNLHLPVIGGNSKYCTLCEERNKFEQLYNDSLLIRFKYLFNEKVKKLKPENISKYYELHKEEKKPYKDSEEYILEVEAIHRVYEYFRDKNNQRYFLTNTDIFAWVKHLLSHTDKPLYQNRMSKKEFNKGITSNVDVLIKVLSRSPFNKYKPIKNKIFSWSIYMINDCVEAIKNKNYKDITYDEFRKLKYMMKRVAQNGSNYLISDRFIAFIIKLYESGCLSEIKDRSEYEKIKYSFLSDNFMFEPILEKEDSILNNIDDFPDYFVTLIKELLFQNESRCVVLERRVNAHMKNIKSLSDPLNELFRILYFENGIIIKRFWEFYKGQSQYQNILELKNRRHFQYNLINEFFNANDRERPEINYLFNKYLDINKYLMEDGGNEDYKPLEVKTNELCELLMQMMYDNDYKNKGMYLLINYDNMTGQDQIYKNTFLAYNEGPISNVISANWYEKYDYIIKFISGIKSRRKKYVLTIDVLKKYDNSWNSIYSPSNNDDISIDYINNEVDVNYILLIRLSIKNPDKNENIVPEPQGVLVFYSNENVFTIEKVRFLLLIREAISAFINKHHKNNEFKDWREKSEQLELISAIYHDTDVYKNAFKNLSKSINGQDYLKRYLDVIVSLMFNKLLIIKFVKEYLEIGDLKKTILKNRIASETLTFKQIKNKIKEYIKIIFEFKHDEFSEISEEYYLLEFQFNSNESINIYTMFFDDIIFELLFNIRRQFSDYIGEHITEADKMIVRCSIDNDNMAISNTKANLIYLQGKDFTSLNSSIKDKTKIKGLNLINSVSELLYDRPIIIDMNTDVFSIKIPIK